MTPPDRDAALELLRVGWVRFNHEPNDPTRMVVAVHSGMIALLGMEGYFAPHLFTPAAPPTFCGLCGKQSCTCTPEARQPRHDEGMAIRNIIGEWDIPDTDRVEIKPVRYRSGMDSSMGELRSLMEASDRLHAFEDTPRQLLAAYDELQAHPTGNNLAAAVQVHVDELRALVKGKIEEPKP